jgi:hypothetical protein
MPADAFSVDSLRYPVGRFVQPPAFLPASVREWRHDLADLPSRVRDAIRGLNQAQLDTPYREGGWTIRQTVHHLADSHVNAYVRFRLALTEADPTIRPYDEALWAELPDARTMPVGVSIELLSGLHARWIALIDTFRADEWQRTYIHPEQHRAVPLWQATALYAWHCRHHVAHINHLRGEKGWRE